MGELQFESPDHCERILQVLPAGVITLSPSGYIKGLNSPACELLDYAVDNLVGEPVETIVESREWFRDVKEVIRDNPPYRTEYRLKNRNNQSVPVILSVSAITDDSGTITELILVAKGTELTGEDDNDDTPDETSYRQFFENSTHALLQISQAGTIEQVNPVAEDTFGYEKDDLIGEPVEVLVPESLRAGHVEQRENYVDNPEARPMGQGRELEAVRKDGSTFPVEIGLNPVRTKDGLKIITDVTDLTYFRRLLDEKNTLLKEVLHRVKNNLQLIVSLLNLESRNSAGRTPDEVIGETKNRVQSMALLHDVLYRGQEGFSDLNLGSYLRELVNQLLKVHSNPDTVTVDYDYSTEITLGIETSLYCGLIVNEAITNVLKYADKETGENRIEIGLLKRADGTFQLSVKDNGPGLPDTLDPEETDSTGLRIMRSLAEKQLGGEIQFIQDGGTEVVVTFPDKREEHD